MIKKCVIVLSLLATSGCTSVAMLPDGETMSLTNDLSSLTSAKNGIYYRVKEGDTLWKIAKAYQIDVSSLMRANQEVLRGATELKPGQMLFIPQTKTTVVQPVMPYRPEEFIWPVKGKTVGTPSENGINIQSRTGEPVVAVKSGLVTYTTDYFPGLGKVVVIKHPDSFTSLYGYNSEILVKTGDQVQQGQMIARVGQTGRARATGAQLHFLLMKNDNLVNPLSYLK